MEYTLDEVQAGRLRIIALLATLPSRQTPAIPDALRIALALFDAEIARRLQPAQLPLPDPCPDCRGSGIASEYSWTNAAIPQGWDCPACQGSGIAPVREVVR